MAAPPLAVLEHHAPGALGFLVFQLSELSRLEDMGANRVLQCSLQTVDLDHCQLLKNETFSACVLYISVLGVITTSLQLSRFLSLFTTSSASSETSAKSEQQTPLL